MSREALVPLLSATGLPVVVGSWDDDEVVQFPFVEYHRIAGDDLNADNINFGRFERWQISIYSKQKTAAEFWGHCSTLEEAFCDARVAFKRSDDLFVDDVIFAEYSFSIAH